MPINIQKTSEVKVNGIKMIVYGKAGMGKTVLCSTAPKPIIISAENGLLSLAEKEIDFIKVSTLAEVNEAYKYCKESDYETICIDSLSEIGEVVLAEFKKGEKDGRQAYMKLATALNAMIRNFRDIEGKNVIFTAKVRTLEDDNTGITTFVPSMPGRVMPDSLPYLVDVVGCIKIGKSKDGDYRYIQTQPDISWEAKDRSGKLDKKERPDLTYMFNKILGKEDVS